MKGKNLMNLLLSILCVLISVIAYFFLRDKWKWFWVWGSGILALVYVACLFYSGIYRRERRGNRGYYCEKSNQNKSNNRSYFIE